VHQFVNALSEGPVEFHYPGPDADTDFGLPGRAARQPASSPAKGDRS
jgi:phospholipid/cholesterol/gamma-HCH transport system ATP-binding protein